jgi:hypothetical protein
MVSSSNNIVTHNIIENSKLGYKIDILSNSNIIDHNDLINNLQQATDLGTNYWDNGYPSGGNYWSDYAGADNYRGENQNISGSDNIGDTPYVVLGGTNTDRYPLMNPFKAQPELQPEASSGQPWALMIGIVILAVVVICVVGYLLNSRKRGLDVVKFGIKGFGASDDD